MEHRQTFIEGIETAIKKTAEKQALEQKNKPNAAPFVITKTQKDNKNK